MATDLSATTALPCTLRRVLSNRGFYYWSIWVNSQERPGCYFGNEPAAREWIDRHPILVLIDVER